MTDDLNDSLTEVETDAVHTFLADLSGPIRSVEGLDGLLCALTCAPTQVSLDSLIDTILGSDTFTDADEAQSITAIVSRHRQIIQAGLSDTLTTEAVYTPVLLVDEQDKAMGNEWALGFLMGVAMTEGDWADFAKGDQLGQLFLPMMVLAHEHHPDPKMRPSEISDTGRQELLLMMTSALASIYKHFHG